MEIQESEGLITLKCVAICRVHTHTPHLPEKSETTERENVHKE